MTSDAKIGLLLGLVFIFVIAFIINGLPNFGSRPGSVDAAPAATFDSDNISGLLGETANASDILDYQELMGQGAADDVLATEDPALELPEPETPAVAIDSDEDTGMYRGIYGLDDIASRVPQVSQVWDRVVHELTEAGSEAVRMQNPAAEPLPTGEASSDGSHRIVPRGPESDRVVTTLSDRSDRTPPASEKTSVRSILNRTYVVKEGDVLATVAKNVYGPVEGNRLANIEAIYKANSMVLKSPDEIFVGQTLIIPALPQSQPQAGAETPNPTLAEPLFEKVEAVGRRNLPETPALKPGERWYTVEEGDSLWKIASAQLGSGARCDEIAKMNVDALKNRDTLSIGMKLRLPSK